MGGRQEERREVRVIRGVEIKQEGRGPQVVFQGKNVLGEIVTRMSHNFLG